MQRVIMIPIIVRAEESVSRDMAMGGRTMEENIPKKMLRVIRNLKLNGVWKTLQDHWKLYLNSFVTRVSFKMRYLKSRR